MYSPDFSHTNCGARSRGVAHDSPIDVFSSPWQTHRSCGPSQFVSSYANGPQRRRSTHAITARMVLTTTYSQDIQGGKSPFCGLRPSNSFENSHDCSPRTDFCHAREYAEEMQAFSLDSRLQPYYGRAPNSAPPCFLCEGGLWRCRGTGCINRPDCGPLSSRARVLHERPIIATGVDLCELRRAKFAREYGAGNPSIGCLLRQPRIPKLDTWTICANSG